MVLGKGYKGGRSRGVSTKTSDPPPPSPPQTISKTEQNAAENESFMGPTLPGGWKDDPI